ncbi:MAG: GNAT family N-acetyltransferase [Gammaproteobacteria bacterium]|nr:GNAT family N-acetyltransferase [Gammaproteobacteria bacterium]
MTSSSIEVRPVRNRADKKAFVKVLWSLYQDDPNWVPPLIMERMDAIDESKNPFFQHAEVRLWIAYRNNQPVGRISAQIDELVQQCHGIKTGHFGYFDCIEDQGIANALLDTACSWLRDRGMVEVIGPFSLSINEETGMLVEGFNTRPMLLMGHSRPYLQRLAVNYGLTKAKDTWAYEINIENNILAPSIQRRLDRTIKLGKVSFRPINMEEYEKELKTILDIFNDAWAGNWKFIPFTQAELDHAVKEMKMIIREDFTYIAEVNGVPQGMMVSLPNINEMIVDLNGRLFPFGLLKLLWRLKLNPSFKTARVPLMGIRRKYQNSQLGGIMSFGLFEACRKSGLKVGCKKAELSWVLEDNIRLAKLLDTIGCKKYKRYRLFHKAL